MRNLLLIAKREYLEQVRGKAFRLSTILIPVLFVVIMGVVVLAGKNTAVGKHIAIASEDPQLAARVQKGVLDQKELKATVDIYAPAQPSMRDTLLKGLQDKSIDGFLWVEQAADGKITATYTSESSGDIVISNVLTSSLNDALINDRLRANGVTQSQIDAALKKVEVQTMQVDKEGKIVKSNGVVSYLKGYIMALLLSMTTMIYGMNVARSIIQEKTSRIFEVMLSTARSGDLLAGKLIGVGAVGMTQIGIWAAAAAALAGTALAAPLMSGEYAVHFTWKEGILFPIYFILGYLLYSALFSGLAATCETEQELQMYTPLAAVPIWLSFSLIFLVINDPNSIWSIAASLFPATAPIIMMLRMGSQMPPDWQFVASIAIMIFTIWGVLWFSTRLYRVGILMYGKRATLPELLKWIRYS